MIHISQKDERALSALERAATRIATAHAESRLRARHADPLRWRMAGLLWPLFAKD